MFLRQEMNFQIVVHSLMCFTKYDTDTCFFQDPHVKSNNYTHKMNYQVITISFLI